MSNVTLPMSLLHDDAFLAHLSQCKASAKEQVNSMIDSIYVKVLLDLELWLNKHESNHSVHQLTANHNNVQNNEHSNESIFPITQQMHQNVNCLPSLPHLQSHSNHLTIKSEIDSDCEKNVTTDHNFPGKIEINSQVTKHNSNDKLTTDRSYLPTNNKIDDDANRSVDYGEFRELGDYEESNRLPQNVLTQPPSDQQTNMHFDDDEEYDQETLDQVKREIEEEEEMKRRENELKGGDERHDEGDQMGSELANDSQSTFGDNFHDESMVIQQEERDTNNAIGEESIATEYTINPTQPSLAQPNRQFQCQHCHKSFDSDYKLQTHLRVHTGERPFHCDQCDKRFSQKHHLDSHLLIHSGERPFACRHCEKSFTASGTRKKHEQSIHLHVKPYRCKQCGFTSTQRSHVNTHIRMVHFGLPKSIKQQRALNIIDDRDPKKLVERV